ncbi:hypothetical protein FOL47_002909 [Perkinsus chesapeaki]|uniref:RNase H type-1 domain-containing protein n=1 Tax=Perkinsus chesapeaki TaxID=330153 RepID=A0A7J6KQ17_PERCH|nr:hypothetical protein FOL47_002909 [Perkinsus chesapeaki]
MKVSIDGGWVPHFEEALSRARREIEMCRRLVARDGCPCLSHKGREVIRNHITGVLAYGLNCWGERLKFKTTRDRVLAVDLRLEKVLLGLPCSANPELASLLSDRKSTIYEKVCSRFAAASVKGISPSRKWWEKVVGCPPPDDNLVDVISTGGPFIAKSSIHIGSGDEIGTSLEHGLTRGREIFPGIEAVIYTDGSRIPASKVTKERVGCGFYSSSRGIGYGRMKLPSYSNIAQAEAAAILSAVKKVIQTGSFSSVLIASDSQAVLKGLLAKKKTRLLCDLLEAVSRSDVNFYFIWVRGHAGCAGNSIADGMARSGAEMGTAFAAPIPESFIRNMVSDAMKTRFPQGTSLRVEDGKI